MYKTARARIAVGLTAMAMVLLLLGPSAAALETDVGENDLFAEIVEFVKDRDPVLRSQRAVMEAAEAMDTIELDDDAVPGLTESSLRVQKFESVSQVQQAQQTYTQVERDLVSALLANLTDILSLRNAVENQKELLSLLEDRLVPTERQVEAGIVDADALWELSERIIDVQTEIDDSNSQLTVLKRETAFNYGGEDWRALLELVEQFD